MVISFASMDLPDSANQFSQFRGSLNRSDRKKPASLAEDDTL
jgi:hypothetical protein